MGTSDSTASLPTQLSACAFGWMDAGKEKRDKKVNTNRPQGFISCKQSRDRSWIAQHNLQAAFELGTEGENTQVRSWVGSSPFTLWLRKSRVRTSSRLPILWRREGSACCAHPCHSPSQTPGLACGGRVEPPATSCFVCGWIPRPQRWQEAV